MALIEINRDPSPRELRQFGLIALFALPLLAWLFTTSTDIRGCLFGGQALIWHGGNVAAIAVSAVVGGSLALLGYIKPQWLAPIFIGLSYLTMPIGLVLGEAIMLITYFALFVPVGLFFRLIGRDSLQRKINRASNSYWREKRQPREAQSYFRQF